MPTCFSEIIITLEGAFFEKMLLIDDNINFLILLSNLLQRKFEVYMATGVKEAMHIFESIYIDMICSDYFMTDGTGFDILKR